ncbi:hypothetical protein BC830DRAFT_1055792, partial [Chytriomyces sp. MP71]
TTSNASIAASPSDSPAPAKRKIQRCALGCGAAAVKTVGDCRFCSQKFCAKHRFVEAHACANMQSCHEQAKSGLASKLLAEKTAGAKV